MGSSRLSLLAVVAVLCLAVVGVAHAHSSPADWIRLHNSARARVGVGPVSWDGGLAQYARNYAQGVARDCRLAYPGGPYGANAYWGRGARRYTAGDALSWWFAERQYYHYRRNTCDPGRSCRNYKQLVWRNSRSIGCASVRCSGGDGYYMLCVYNPKGNIPGRRPY
ncbi:hypothetical protein Taro_040841 [Colocasia esculenta]|uniref:SCP domain-containing protein n=1 Tax=Colocasia esculenta TaxID=4460 RepID=A0A843WN16_COLES|nr:hypothetical protein [Colocasia esculenta]